MLKLFSKFLILSMIVIFPLSRLSRVIPVVFDVVSIALKLYNVNDFKHPTVCIAQLDFLTLMCVFNCAAGKSSWQSWRFYLLCPWQKEYNWQSAWGDDLLKLHSENFRKLSTTSIKSVSLYKYVPISNNTFKWRIQIVLLFLRRGAMYLVLLS